MKWPALIADPCDVDTPIAPVIAAAGTGVLLTDHSARDALRACDRVALLDGGLVIFRGSPAQLAADGGARDRYLGAGFELAGGAPFTPPGPGPKM